MKIAFLVACAWVLGVRECWGQSGAMDGIPPRSIFARWPEGPPAETRQHVPLPNAQPEPVTRFIGVTLSNETYTGFLMTGDKVTQVVVGDRIGDSRVLAMGMRELKLSDGTVVSLGNDLHHRPVVQDTPAKPGAVGSRPITIVGSPLR